MEVVLGIFFLTLSNADIQYIEKKLTWKFYTIAKVLPTTKQVELIDKKKFAKVVLNKNFETFATYMISITPILVHPDRKTQIASIFTKEVKISDECLDFIDVFLEGKTLILLEQTVFNQHAIELEKSKQPSYAPIYNLGAFEVEILKTYIETYLKIGFLWPFKSPTNIPILFDKNLDGNCCFCINYWALNDLTIKNWYPLLFIGKSLDNLRQAKRFTQLDLTSTYHRMRIKEGDE